MKEAMARMKAYNKSGVLTVVLHEVYDVGMKKCAVLITFMSFVGLVFFIKLLVDAGNSNIVSGAKFLQSFGVYRI